MDERAVNELRALDRRDAELASQVERLRLLDAEIAAIRDRAEAIAGFFAGHPAEVERHRLLLAAARAELERRNAELAAARAQSERARDEVAQVLARRALERATDHVDVAQLGLEEAEAACSALEHEASVLPAEVVELERCAVAAASRAERFPRPEPAARPQALAEWASRAHAAVFVEERQLETEREHVIREANELASMLLGEPTYGSTTAQARTRVEASLSSRAQAWTSDPGQVSGSR